MTTRWSSGPIRGRVRRRFPTTLFALAALLTLCLQLSPGPVAAQEPVEDAETLPVTLHLRDADTGEPLLGALIELAGVARRYVTGIDGRVSFEIPAGDYAIVVRKGGYATLQGDFRVVYRGDLTVAMRELGDMDTSVPGRLIVRVAEFGSGTLIEGATVSLPGGRTRLTDERGWVAFGGLEGLDAEVTVESYGYETRTGAVALREGRTTVVEVGLSIDAVVLAPLEVTAESGFLEKQGVYWRIDRGWPDKLLTRNELVERAEPRLADAFRHLAGVRVDYRGALAVLTTHMGCPIPVFLDGRPLGLNVVGLNIDDIEAEDVELAEYYDPGRVPSQYVRPSANNCGAVLLWSRRAAGKG